MHVIYFLKWIQVAYTKAFTNVYSKFLHRVMCETDKRIFKVKKVHFSAYNLQLCDNSFLTLFFSNFAFYKPNNHI